MKTISKMLLVTSVVTLGAAVAAPAFAGSLQAYASGSATMVLMNGASQSIGGEVAAPPGPSFANGTVSVILNNVTVLGGGVPVAGVGPDLSLDTTLLTNLNVYPGAASGTPNPNASVEAAVATLINGTLNNDATLATGISLTRAWQSGLR